MDRQKFQFEVCANSVESCIKAQAGGADRVELCSGLSLGGITPSYATIKEARKLLDIKLHVIIRPRGGDFHYSSLDLRIMEKDIQLAELIGVDGIVIGCLNTDGSINMEAMKRFKDQAGDMSITFHRAFDCCKDPEASLDQLISLGVDRVLTSGCAASAPEGVDMLARLHKQAQSKIHIMAGCGINDKNIVDLYRNTGIHQYHFSAREKYPSCMSYFNPNVFMGEPGSEENTFEVTSLEKVTKTIGALIDTSL
jgi:copper homeostasis protein